MIMKKTLIGLLFALGLPLVAVAGGMGGPGGPEGEQNFKQHHAEKIAAVAKELGLTADQQSKVDAIFEQQHTKFQAIHEETKTRLQAVLTPEQLKKFDNMHPPRHMMPPPPPPKPE
jgi:Spy/CpxP family protein refolding chaperone